MSKIISRKEVIEYIKSMRGVPKWEWEGMWRDQECKHDELWDF